MAETAELVIALLAKDAASSVLGGIGKKLDGLGKAGDVAKVALAGLTAGLGAAVAVGIDFAKAAADEEQGIARLDAALRPLVGNSLPDVKDAWEGAIAEMERVTAFSDGEMRDSLSMLVAQTQDADEAWKRLPIAMDFARGAGIDLATASKLLGKVTDETTNVLGRYGIHMEKGADATKVLEEVQKRFGGQAAAFAETATGKWQIFGNQIDNLKEDIGGALLPLFSGMADVATGAIDAIRAALAKPEIQDALRNIVGFITTAKDIFGELFGVISGTAPDAGAALTKAIGPDAAKFIMGALALLRDTVKAIMTGDIPGALGTLNARVPDLIGTLTGMVSAAVPMIGAALLDWGKQFVAWVGPQIQPMLGELLGLLTTGLQWLGDHTEEIGAQLVQWGLQFGRFIVDVALPALKEHLPPIVTTIVVWAATEALPAIQRAFFNLGKGMVTGIADAFGQSVNDVWSAFSYMIRQAIGKIDFWVGPFHISGTSGITISMPTINLPSIPGILGLANGGQFVTNGPTLAMFGEGRHRRELVTATPLGGGGVARATGANQPIVTQVFLDGRQIAEAVGDFQLRRADALGGTLQ